MANNIIIEFSYHELLALSLSTKLQLEGLKAYIDSPEFVSHDMVRVTCKHLSTAFDKIIQNLHDVR